MVDITCVLETAKYKSVSKASEQLYISQPALSQRIKKLEQELGYELFVRTAQGVYLTTMGEAFCQEAQPVAEAWDQLCRWVDEHLQTGQRKLRIGLGARVYSSGLFEDVVRFFDLHPSIDVAFVTEAGRDFLPLLKNDSLDLALDRLPPEEFLPVQNDFVVYDLLCEKQCILMSWDDPLAQREKIKFSDLQGCTMISALEGSIEDKMLKSICAKNNITLKRLYRLDNIDMIMDLVQKGKGVVIGPQSFASYYGVASAVLQPETNVYLKFICLEKNSRKKEIVQFQQYLEKVCQMRNHISCEGSGVS